MRLTFVESKVFTDRIARMGLEAAVRELQAALLVRPDAGDLDPGTGGLRKIRMPDSSRGKGKRSGARVHYLWLPHVSRVYFLFVYGKDETTSLSPTQQQGLATIARAIKTAVGTEGE